jgi:enoyl-CoA hydratase/carnithine racemase
MDTVKTELHSRVLHITLNRADKRNAFNSQMLHELSAAYGQLEASEDAWCGLLMADGDHFTGGLDLAEVGPKIPVGHDLFPEDGIDPLDLFGKRRIKPVVCVVQGWCLTIGIELLLASDIRVAASNTRFRQM